ncbi:hypothetical protein Tco_0158421 [Tanacetum coccineum]
MEMEPDIENMTLNEYLDYEAEKERRLLDNLRSKSSPTRYERDVDFEKEEAEDDDGDTYDIWDITVKDVERIRQFLMPNIPDEMDDPYRLCTGGGAWILIKLQGSIENQTSWMLYRWFAKLPVMVDVAWGRRLRAWL